MNTRLSLPDLDTENSGEGLRYAVAFGGGGARGISHICIIEALDELGIKPVAISGSSIGAIMGAGMASGMRGADIRDYTVRTMGNRNSLFNRLWTLGPASMRDKLGGFRFGHFNLDPILDAFLPPDIPEDFSDLKIPLKISATDYYGQAEVILEEGDLRTAIAASAAIPGLFMPVWVNGRVMIDGGVFNPVPYEQLLDLADVVIGVDVVGAPEGDGTHPPTRIDALFGASQLTMQASIALKLKLNPPHIFLRPQVNRFRVLDFLKAQEILDEASHVKDELKRAVDALQASVAKG
ncbi:patatin-like phospholipase family protein [Aliirhizobium cellulosilyticum]|uniref:NTE family protein n=1 Tax=Aliirhizobium cellulosilyticum TaxID=393664 RepID=A0A7W6TE14_9HYPH|nr:patatin-like phospholipase family protein [Rhizobium cellulosilyticum]MBB4348531.1 NTE family protein [Rhizobium cellulosilyticum]MBB4411767.1 NTE family protein [Rhizobium cellulosilyticum]MBB4446458.1 NTE family protein [Rhizobium cellulosilyticum]